jgi:glycosyltransferase involved in cell wall biosynthesis
MKPFSIDGKILVLRETRLGRLPPALHATEILVEAGFPVLAFEYGEPIANPQSRKIPGKIPRLRFCSKVSLVAPKRLRAVVAWFATLFHLAIKVLWQGRPALLISHGLSEQTTAWVLNRLFKIPYVCHLHEIFDPEELSTFNRFLLRLENTVVNHAAFAMCPEFTRRDIFIARYGTKVPIYFVPNCPRKNIPEESYPLRRHLGIPPGTTLILYMGGIGKNIPLMECMEALVSFPNAHLLLAGWGDNHWITTLKSHIKKIGLSGRVHFLGPVENRFAYFNAVDIAFCVYRMGDLRLRHAATASNKMFEGMATGKPVVVRDTPDFRKIVQEGDCGVLCEVTTEGIRTALASLLQNPEGARQKGLNGRCLFLSHFYYEKYFQPLLPVFRSAALGSLEESAADLPDPALDLPENLV